MPEEARASRLAQGARDLADQHPPGRDHARALIRELLAALSERGSGEPLLLAGFSQGAMLACDTLLLEEVRAAGLVMMSASRIAIDEWLPRMDRLQGLRAFVSHGREDRDLAFTAGERLEHFLRDGGAAVTWVPFDGGHEIPFRVWREFRSFAQETHGTH
jgi:phospholipase/carboxylesterase